MVPLYSTDQVLFRIIFEEIERVKVDSIICYRDGRIIYEVNGINTYRETVREEELFPSFEQAKEALFSNEMKRHESNIKYIKGYNGTIYIS